MASTESITASNIITTQKNNAVSTAKSARSYGKVVISLENCLLPQEKLIETPSKKDGISTEDEIDLRIVGCDYIQHAGILLRLPQVYINIRGRLQNRGINS